MEGQIHSGLPWAQGAEPIVGDGWVQIGGSSGKKIFFDQLSKADQDLVIQYLLSAQFPLLTPPETVVSSNSGGIGAVGAAASLQVDQKRHEIIIAMLDGWLESIKKIGEANKRAEEKRVIERMSIMHHEVKRQEELQPNENFPLFALGMVLIATGIHQSLLVNPTIGNVQINPFVNMAHQITPPIMGDMRAELGLIGAIFAAGIQYFTVAQGIAAGGKGGSSKDAAFAKGYAENILGLMRSAGFNAYLLAIVTQSVPNGKTLDPQRAQELVAMVKIILLSSALAMLYQVEAGKMTGIEFGGMLNGNIKLEAGELKAHLASQIKGNLKLLSPKDQENVLNLLMEYFDGDPSIDSLADPSKVFAGISKTLSRGELAG